MELKPCPFCGGDASQSVGSLADGTPWPYIECEDCAASAEPNIWNTRAAASEWRPIDDEAKNGEDILVWGPHQLVRCVYWDEDKHQGYSWCVDDAHTCYHRDAFTHWQPLPAPPTSAGDDSGAE